MGNNDKQSLLSVLENTKFGASAFNNSGISTLASNSSFRASGSVSFRSNASFTFPAGCFGFSPPCSFNASFNASFNSSFDSSFNGSFNSSFNSSNFAFLSSFNSGFNATFDSSFNAGNFAFKDFAALTPISYSERITWNDIKTIYNNLNITKRQYGIAQDKVPELKDNTAAISNITNLKDLIQAMSSNSHIGQNASTTTVAIPKSGDALRTNTFTDLNAIIEKVHDNCTNFIGT